MTPSLARWEAGNVMVKGGFKKAPVGSSQKKSLDKSSAPGAKSKGLHSAGKTVATWDSMRNDKLEATTPAKDGKGGKGAGK